MTIREQISAEHDRLFNEAWVSRGYISESELNSAAATPTCPYYEEAKAILKWYWDVWALIEAADITEETDPQTFISTLPPFTY